MQLFRLWLGATEYLFRKKSLLEEAIAVAVEDTSFRSDDLEFTFAARVSPLWIHLLTPFRCPFSRHLLQFFRREFALSPDQNLTPELVLQGWSECVSFGSFESYRDRFEKTQAYFAPRFPNAIEVGNQMLRTILEKTHH